VQAQLNHPGVAQILEASTDEKRAVHCRRVLEGRSLADVRHRAVQVGARIGWPRRARSPSRWARLSARPRALGLRRSPLGIVHRDLSPQNVMIGHAGR